MTNLDSILKSRDIILPTKVCTVIAMVFPVVMYAASTLRDISISEKVLALPSALENLPQSDSLNMNEDWVLRSSTRLRHLTWRSLRSPNIRR